jgi:localization factor PodJL
MKQTLPWNVTGIPPEARDMARAAAARDGMSVGDWLTRRIYSETHHPAHEPRVEQFSSPYRYEHDSETRREREELVHRLARTEAETESAFRRIDETLRNLSRRLETTERSQNEAKIAMHAASSEINATTREQAQSFNHIARRMETVERSSDTGALRDAVRGLHQGLSRVADQIARTANESSNQVNTLATNVDSLAKKIASTRDETGRMAHDIATVRDESGRLAQEVAITRDESSRLARDLEQRLDSLTERLAHSEQQMEGAEDRIQETVSRHLSTIHRNLETISERFSQSERTQSERDGAVNSAMDSLRARLEAAEKRSQEALAEFRSSLEETNRRLDTVDVGPGAMGAYPQTPHHDPYAVAPMPMRPVEPMRQASDFDLPPFPEAPQFPEAQAAELPPFSGNAYEPPPFGDVPPMPPSDNAYASASAGQDYLSAARRAAKAAAEAEPAKKSRFQLASSRPAASREHSGRQGSNRTSALAIAAALLLLIGGGAFLYARGFNPFQSSFTAGPAVPQTGYGDGNFAVLPPVLGPEASLPETGMTPAAPLTSLPDLSDPVPSYSANIEGAPPAIEGTFEGPVDDAAPPRPPAVETAAAPSAPAAETAPPAAAQPPAQATQAVSGPSLAAPQVAGSGAPTPLDRLLSQARAGSPAAALVLGLKYLDGDGVAVSVCPKTY